MNKFTWLILALVDKRADDAADDRTYCDALTYYHAGADLDPSSDSDSCADRHAGTHTGTHSEADARTGTDTGTDADADGRGAPARLQEKEEVQ